LAHGFCRLYQVAEKGQQPEARSENLEVKSEEHGQHAAF
jgi:hypothetical protein